MNTSVSFFVENHSAWISLVDEEYSAWNTPIQLDSALVSSHASPCRLLSRSFCAKVCTLWYLWTYAYRTRGLSFKALRETRSSCKKPSAGGYVCHLTSAMYEELMKTWPEIRMELQSTPYITLPLSARQDPRYIFNSSLHHVLRSPGQWRI